MLAWVAGAVAVAVALEAGWRIVRSTKPTGLSGGLQNALLLAVVVSAAGGLGIVVGGGSPAESLHYLYAVLALGAVPVVSSLTRRLNPRPQAAATAVTAIVVFVVIVRLFQTG